MTIGNDRNLIKGRLRAAYPGEKEGAYVNWTAIVAKFAFELKPSDYVVSPVRASRTIDVAIVDGAYFFDATASVHKHRLPVKWLATRISRDVFTPEVLHENWWCIDALPCQARSR